MTWMKARVEPENESLQKEKVKLLEEWEEVKGEMFVAQATQDGKILQLLHKTSYQPLKYRKRTYKS